MRLLEQRVNGLLEKAGIELNGTRPFDPQIRDRRIFRRFLLGGSLALGEGFVNGDWTCKDLVDFFERVFDSRIDEQHYDWYGKILALAQNFYNEQGRRLSRRVAKHYDLSPKFYRQVLGSSILYTCAYFARDTNQNLRQAQRSKMRLVCEKLGLKKGERILDIGCGWGEFAKFAAEEYGVQVVGITISEEQLKHAREYCKNVPGVEFLFLDYRDLPKRFAPDFFDHAVSIGMAEAVGPKNYRIYFKAIRAVLKSSGLFLLHMITADKPGFDAWLHRYIFECTDPLSSHTPLEQLIIV